MKKLLSLSTGTWDTEMFCNNSKKIYTFLEKHNIHGLEVVQAPSWDASIIPQSMIVGVHMPFWPMWLDFWKGDMKKVLTQFGDKLSYEKYYGGETRDVLVERYKKELDTASRMGADYVVFHVSHVELEHCYNYRFAYSDDKIIDAFSEMINEVLTDVNPNFTILFENHWYPGLRLLDRENSLRLLDKVDYKNIGFMLDIGHMMNTNMELKSEAEGVEYILEILNGLEDSVKHIKGIHLNSALSGEYVKSVIANPETYDASKDFFSRYSEVYGHILKIDTHIPFKHESINKVIDYIKPQFIVYEFIADNFNMLDSYISLQNSVII